MSARTIKGFPITSVYQVMGFSCKFFHMIKYIISSGTSAVCEFSENGQIASVKVTNEDKKAMIFDTIGEAMLQASKVNKILGSHQYRAVSIEV